MNNDCHERDCQLPGGCKELIDVIKLKENQPGSLIELSIPEKMSVEELACFLNLNPIHLILDLLEMGISVKLHEGLDFQAVSGIIRKYRGRVEGDSGPVLPPTTP